MAGPTFFFEDSREPDAARGLALGGAPWMGAVDENTDVRIAPAEAKGTRGTGVKLLDLRWVLPETARASW